MLVAEAVVITKKSTAQYMRMTRRGLGPSGRTLQDPSLTAAFSMQGVPFPKYERKQVHLLQKNDSEWLPLESSLKAGGSGRIGELIGERR
jgi:hypothetical protein